MVDAAPGRWCPNARCRAALPPEAPACPTCGITLTGADADRLREVDRQLTELWAESAELTARLLPSEPTGTAAPAYPRSRGLSGQQLLLGLGAVLTLSAAGFFLFVVWDLIGPAGQLLAVGALVAAAVWASYVAARRSLPAAAETAAVLVAGFTTLVLAAAYALGWMGVDRLDGGSYAALAALATGALLLGVDLGTPRGLAIRTYRPAGAAALGLAPWFAYVGLVPDSAVGVVVGLLLVALLDGAGWLVALRLDRRTPGAARGWRTPARLLAAGAGAAYVLHVLLGWVAGYEVSVPLGERLAVAAVLLLGPLLLALAALPLAVPTTGADSVVAARSRLRGAWAPPLALGLAAPPLGVPVTELPHPVVALLAVAAAAAWLVASLDRRPLAPGWRRAGTAFVGVAASGLALLVLLLDAAGLESLYGDVSGLGGPGVTATTGVLALWAAAVTSAGRRGYEVLGAVTGPARRNAAALVLVLVAGAELAWALTGGRVLVEANSLGWWCLGGLAFLLANLTVAAVLVRGRDARPSLVAVAALVEMVLLAGAAGGALLAVSAAGERGSGTLALTLLASGVAVMAYAGLPERLPVAYVGALLTALGGQVLADDAGITAVEVTSLPLALLLAGIGVVQHRRRAETPTMVLAGPTLAVALGPTLAVAVDDGDNLRLALVSAASLLVLVAGLHRRWRAPVTAGGAVLVVVAVTQGGPLVAELPTVLTLGTAGAALLAIGVAWEQAVLAGRRANAWYTGLR